MIAALITALSCRKAQHLSPIDEVVLSIVTNEGFQHSLNYLGSFELALDFWLSTPHTYRLSNNYVFDEGRRKHGAGEWWAETGAGPFLEIHYVSPFPEHEKKIVFRYTEKSLVNLISSFYSRKYNAARKGV